jgi:uncharacterized protein YegP (UPF0339 family)
MYHLHTFKDRAKEWRWSLVSSNGKFVACSGEGYKHKKHCLAMARKLFAKVMYKMAGT